jgi:hypothetical protein
MRVYHELRKVENCYADCESNSGMGCPMTIEANKAVMHRFTEFINTASEKLAAELIAPYTAAAARSSLAQS